MTPFGSHPADFDPPTEDTHLPEGYWCRKCETPLTEDEYGEREGLCIDCTCQHCRVRGPNLGGIYCDPCESSLEEME